MVLAILTSLSVLLLVGIFCSIIADKLRIPNVLLLILTGMVFANLAGHFITFPNLFIAGMAVFALVMIVFDSSAEFRIRKLDRFSSPALGLATVFIVLNFIFLTLFTLLIGGVESVFLALIFSAIMSGTDTSVTLSVLENAKSKTVEIIKLESIINTPLTVLLPFVIIDIMHGLEPAPFISTFMSQLKPVLQQFVTGVGAGLVIAVIVFRIMKREYSEELSPIAIIATALFTYVLAENLGGNGVLAVTTLGVFFGNFKLKEKLHLITFGSTISNALKILVFILVGYLIRFPLTEDFMIKSLSLFIIYLLVRYIAVKISFRNGFSRGEQLFMTLNTSKGIAVAIVVLALNNLGISGIETILNFSLAFIIYSIIVATIATVFSKKLLFEDKEKIQADI